MARTMKHRLIATLFFLSPLRGTSDDFLSERDGRERPRRDESFESVSRTVAQGEKRYRKRTLIESGARQLDERYVTDGTDDDDLFDMLAASIQEDFKKAELISDYELRDYDSTNISEKIDDVDKMEAPVASPFVPCFNDVTCDGTRNGDRIDDSSVHSSTLSPTTNGVEVRRGHPSPPVPSPMTPPSPPIVQPAQSPAASAKGQASKKGSKGYESSTGQESSPSSSKGQEPSPLVLSKEQEPSSVGAKSIKAPKGSPAKGEQAKGEVGSKKEFREKKTEKSDTKEKISKESAPKSAPKWMLPNDTQRNGDASNRVGGSTTLQAPVGGETMEQLIQLTEEELEYYVRGGQRNEPSSFDPRPSPASKSSSSKKSKKTKKSKKSGKKAHAPSPNDRRPSEPSPSNADSPSADSPSVDQPTSGSADSPSSFDGGSGSGTRPPSIDFPTPASPAPSFQIPSLSPSICTGKNCDRPTRPVKRRRELQQYQSSAIQQDKLDEDPI